MYARQLKRTLILSGVIIFMSGCWEQNDVITIDSEGNVTFESEVVITERKMSYREADEFSSEFQKALAKAGWEVEREWVSKEKPFKLFFSGSGNLLNVRSASDFYRLKQVEENKMRIRFIPAHSEGGKSTRSIKFETSFWRNDATILDSNGKSISKIENVLGNKWYTIILE